MREMDEGIRAGRHVVEPAVGTDPHAAVRIGRQRIDAVIRRTAVAIGDMDVVLERILCGIVDRHAIAERADPEPAILREGERAHVIAGQRIGLVGVEAEAFEGVAVVTDQALLRADPDQPIRPLHERRDDAARDHLASIHGPQESIVVRPRRRGRGARRQQQQREQEWAHRFP